MTGRRIRNLSFVVGDYIAGAGIGAATAAGVRAIVDPTLDMALAMLLGMAVGMVVHVILTIAFSFGLGLFHVMAPGGLIGMYGGMFFAMRDTMQSHVGSFGHAVAVGLVFGVAVTAGVRLYDRVLRGPVGGGTE